MHSFKWAVLIKFDKAYSKLILKFNVFLGVSIKFEQKMCLH